MLLKQSGCTGGRPQINPVENHASTFKQQIAKHDTFFPQIMHWSFLPSNPKTIDYIKSNFTVGLWRQFKDKIKLGKQNHSFWSCHYFRLKAKNLLVKCFKPRCTIARFALIIYIKPFSLASGGNSRSILDTANKTICSCPYFRMRARNLLVRDVKYFGLWELKERHWEICHKLSALKVVFSSN